MNKGVASPNREIIGYARESTKDQAINGFNIDDQDKKIRAYFDLYCNTTDVLTVYREEGASAKDLKRPVFQKIIKDIKAQKMDVLIIHNLDRLTRRVKDLSTLLELFTNHSVELVSITERIDTTTPMGRFFIYLIVLIAQWEQDTIGDRAKRGVYESAAQGNYSRGGPAPLGFKRVREGKKVKLLTVGNVVPIIQDIFDKLASNAYTVKSLVRYLNKNEVLGINWYQSRIFNIAKNPIYYGKFSMGTISIENFVPAIISEEKFINVQKAISGRKINTRNKYIFKDLVVCEKCNELCTQEGSNKKNKIYKYYYCKGCNKRINETIILKELDFSLSELYRVDTNLIEIAKLTKEKKRYKTFIGEITEAFENEEESIDNFRDKVFFYKEELRKINLLIKTVRGKYGTLHFSKMPFSMQRKLLKDNFDSIKVDIRGKKVIKLESK